MCPEHTTAQDPSADPTYLCWNNTWVAPDLKCLLGVCRFHVNRQSKSALLNRSHASHGDSPPGPEGCAHKYTPAGRRARYSHQHPQLCWRMHARSCRCATSSTKPPPFHSPPPTHALARSLAHKPPPNSRGSSAMKRTHTRTHNTYAPAHTYFMEQTATSTTFSAEVRPTRTRAPWLGRTVGCTEPAPLAR